MAEQRYQPTFGYTGPVPTTDADLPLRALPESGYVYRTSWPVTTSDIDEHLHLRLDSVARYIQEVGAQNLVDTGEAETHPHWIVNRTVIDVISPIELAKRHQLQSVVLGPLDAVVHDAGRPGRQ